MGDSMSIVLQGSTSGSITLQEPAVAGSNTISLPAATGTAVLTGVSGNVDINAAGSNNVTLSTNSTERVRVDSSGNVGIGITNPSSYNAAGRNLVIGTTSNADSGITVTSGTTATGYLLFADGTSGSDAFTGYIGYNHGSNYMQFHTNGGAERMRITSGGALLIGTTSTDANANPGIKLNASATTAAVAVVNNTAGDNNTYLYFNTNATNNGYRFYVNINGGIYNYSGNNSNLSDERTKENIELAGNYLSKICSIPVKTFNYKDEPTGEQKTLGVIAQDVEAVAPELVNNEGFGETKEGEEPLKSIYTTDMMFAMMKAIQELKGIVDTQATKIAELEAKLEGTA